MGCPSEFVSFQVSMYTPSSAVDLRGKGGNATDALEEAGVALVTFSAWDNHHGGVDDTSSCRGEN